MVKYLRFWVDPTIHSEPNEQIKSNAVSKVIFLALNLGILAIIIGSYSNSIGGYFTTADYIAVGIFLVSTLLARIALMKLLPGHAIYILGSGIGIAGLIGNLGTNFQNDYFIGTLIIAVMLIGAFQSPREATIFGIFFLCISFPFLALTRSELFNTEFLQALIISILIYCPIYFGFKYREQRFQNQLKIIREDKRLFRELFDNAPIPSAIFDENGKIIDLNNATLQLLEVQRQDVLGKSSYFFVNEIDLGLANELTDNLRRTGITQKTILNIRKAGGGKAILYCKFSLLYRRKIPQVFFQAVDITEVETAKIDLQKAKHEAEIFDFERKQKAQAAEIYRLKNVELTQLNEKLSGLLTEKEEMLGVVVHDLKTPITGITLNTDLLEFRTELGSQNKAIGYIEKIRRLSFRMLDIINLLLEAGELDLGQSEINTKYIHLNPFISQVISDNLVHANRKSITLTFHQPDSPLTIEGDPNKLALVLENILSNAIKFSYPEHEITINLLQVNNQIKIEVCDTGQGLTESDFDRLFSRYARLSAQPTGGESSSGLGLYIAKRWVEKMNGTIRATSAGRNKGTKFILTFKATSPTTLTPI